MSKQGPFLFVGHDDALASKICLACGDDANFHRVARRSPLPAPMFYKAIFVATDETAWQMVVELHSQRGDFVVVAKNFPVSETDDEILALGAKQVVSQNDTVQTIRGKLEAVGLLGET